MRVGCLLLYVGIAAAGETAYRVTTVAGGTWCGDGRLAISAQLGSPEGLAADASGNLYIADALDHRVRKVNSAGIVTTLAGDGYPGFRGDGGPARDAELNFPYGVAVDPAGNVYIADLGNGRVRKISTDGVIRTVAGGGTSVAGPDGTEARAARLNQPRNLTLDTAGTLYVSDFGDHRVYRVTSGGLIFRVAGVGTPGSVADTDLVEAATAPLYGPAGLVVTRAGVLFVADSGNHRVRSISAGHMTTVPVPPGLLATPTGLALDASGQLFAADKTGASVVQLTPGMPRIVAGTGVSGWSGDGGPAVAAMLGQPRDLAFDPFGYMYVADTRGGGGIVRRISTTGWIDTVIGDGTFRPHGDAGPALFAHFADPSGIAVDSGGNLYVADRLGQRVRRVAAGGITTLAGTGVTGYAGDGGPAMAAQVNGPAGLALDTTGTLWIAEYAGRVRKVNPAGLIQHVAGSLLDPPGYSGDGGPAGTARLNGPEAVATDGAGNTYIADTLNHVVRKVTADGWIATIAGKGVPGYAGDGGPAAAALLNAPTGLALAPDGGLYIADNGNHVVRLLTPAGILVTVAGTGQQGFSGDGGPAAKAQLNHPAHIALDGDGNLLVADSENHRIRRVAPDGTIRTVAGTGLAGFAGDDGPALEAQFHRPWHLALDGAGNLYVADRGNLRIRKLSPAPLTEPVTPPAEVQVITLVNAASLLTGPVAPGEIVSLFGTNLGPGVAAEARLSPAGLLASELAGTQVFFEGWPAALLYVQFGQINLQVPYGVLGKDSAAVEIRRDGVVRGRLLVPVAPAAPGIFAVASGVGQAAACNEDHTANSASNPAARGTLVTLYATGDGMSEPAGVDGALAVAPYPKPALAVSLTIGGQPATLLYAGAAPGYAGLLQINARVPEDIAPANVALELTVGTARSQPGVFLSVY